ncbi:hypothetical protein [Jeotgalibacillus sp. R-1-5s-1]|uniref:hypothetical protein n=1 Tax=Jeotgalibacillus sp. R-1-5s-1 TaxID=2555897 RepID=UPI00106CBCC9|nr:hypothetical protein [Jeotgalibacillus sp. R-1-5s-1]TFD92331.1 hypothetical protein E2491_16205 [Jeotgalibacillus sp. R-1-5s-1]
MELIIMAIIAGVISLINNQKKKEEPNEKPKPAPVPQSNQQQPQKKAKNLRETFDRHAKELASEYEKQRAEIEKSKTGRQPVKRPDRVKQAAAAKIEVEKPASAPRVSSLKPKKDPIKESDLTINDGLDSKDLVNGIIFSEVLGPPRSKQHYRGNKR